MNNASHQLSEVVSDIPRKARRGGLSYALAQTAYEVTLRHRLPDKLGDYGGVAVRDIPLLDMDDTQVHEAELVEAIRNSVRPGDDVVLVGTGKGVSTVHATIMAGAEGSVVAIDAAQDSLDATKRTLELNATPTEPELRHQAIGEVTDYAREEFGDAAGGECIQPEDIDECDVLILDCESAEKTILEGLSIRPRNLIVESHGFLGSSTACVRELLDELGYRVTFEEAENEELDVMVLSSERREA